MGEPHLKTDPAKNGVFWLFKLLLYVSTNCRGVKSPRVVSTDVRNFGAILLSSVSRLGRQLMELVQGPEGLILPDITAFTCPVLGRVN